MIPNMLMPVDINRLHSDGFVTVQEGAIGEQVQAMRQSRFPIRTAEGLDFCKRTVLDDTRITSVLEQCFDWCGLGIYKVFGSDPTHVYVFMNCPEAKLPALTVQLWEAGSQVEYYAGSQSLDLNTFASSTGLLEVPFARLGRSRPEIVELEHGGMVITDTRLAFRILKGLAIMFVFATREELSGWAKMVLPKDRGLEKMVAEMGASKIGVNFAFQD